MLENNGISLRGMLEQLPTSRLDEMLKAELKKPDADAHGIRLILSILEERESEEPAEMDPRTEAAWQQYQRRLEESRPKPKPVKHLYWKKFAMTAAILALAMTFLIPMQANAETFREMLTRWKQDILEFFNPSEEVIIKEQSFQTDNEGLQQIYDAAIELGIEAPLIPMWFAEYELSTCKITNTSSVSGIMAVLEDSDVRAIFRIDIYNDEFFHGYFGDDAYYEYYEKDGAQYEITQNGDRWVAVWKKDNIEYSFTIDCQEETLRRILASIYVMEE